MANRESLSLCASCDRCRARKTKCDGQRPCSACKNKYMKKHKLTNVDGVDPARFECFYSPAKRRGPVPGQKQRGDNNGSVVGMGSSNGGGVVVGGSGSGSGGGVSSGSGGGNITPKKKKQQGSNNNNSNNKRRQQQQQQQQQHHQASEAVANVHGGLSINIAEDGSVTSTATGNGLGGNRSLSGNNSQHGGNSLHGNPPQAKPTICTPANNINISNSNINNSSRNKNNFGGNNNGFPLLPPLDPSAAAMQQQVLSSLGSIIGMNMFASSNDSRTGGGGGGGGGGILGASSGSGPGLSVGPTNSSGGQDTMATAQNAAQQQLAYIQQLQLQQQMQAQKQRRDMNAAALGTMNAAVTARGSGGGTASTSGTAIINGGHMMGNGRNNNQLSPPVVPSTQQRQNQNNGTVNSSNSTPSTTLKKRVIGCENANVMKYIPLIQPSNAHGTHLRACYTLSFGGLFDLPPIPTDEEYCARFDKSLEPHQLPKFDVAALQAVRFAELAMGALADANCHVSANTTKGTMAGTTTTTSMETSRNDLLLALANASVLCLRDCVEEWIHPSLMFDVARTYFFHAIFRAQFNDMEKYSKYRRLCMRHLAQLDEVPGVETLMAAISFQDSLVYMIHNASEDNLPNIDGEIPRVSPAHDVNGTQTTNAEKKYGIRILPSRVASNPINQIWMQGAPTVLINEAAPAKSRVLDAMACAIRSSLDEAKSRLTKEPIQSSRGRIISRKRKFLSDAEAKDKSATEWEVEHHPELSFINLLAEASNLLKKDEDASSPALPSIFGGHRLLVSALDVILNLDRVADNFQLQRIFNVLEGMIERPIMLFQGGPTYHIFTNCTIFLAHIINKLHSDGFNGNFGKAQFDEAINVYNGSRIVLTKHQSKLPRRLRCHEVPSPNMCAKIGEPMIDLTNTSLCLCRNCQDCIAPGLSAKEVAKRVSINVDKINWQRYDEKQFELNDHALLTVLSRIIAEEEMIL